jgi:hypothetical protein
VPIFRPFATLVCRIIYLYTYITAHMNLPLQNVPRGTLRSEQRFKPYAANALRS